MLTICTFVLKERSGADGGEEERQPILNLVVLAKVKVHINHQSYCEDKSFNPSKLTLFV